MALEDLVHSCETLKRIDVLRVIPQQLSAVLEELDPTMTRAGHKITRINLLCERAVVRKVSTHSLKDLWVFAKVSNVKHLLGIIEVILPLLLKLGVETSSRSKVRDTARRRYSSAGQYNYPLRVA